MVNRLVTRSMKSQGRDPEMFGPIISKTAGDTDSVTIEHSLFFTFYELMQVNG